MTLPVGKKRRHPSPILNGSRIEYEIKEPLRANSGGDTVQIDANDAWQGFTAEEAGCIFDGFDFTDPTFADDMEAIVAVFAACDIDLARLAELGG